MGSPAARTVDQTPDVDLILGRVEICNPVATLCQLLIDKPILPCAPRQ